MDFLIPLTINFLRSCVWALSLGSLLSHLGSKFGNFCSVGRTTCLVGGRLSQRDVAALIFHFLPCKEGVPHTHYLDPSVITSWALRIGRVGLPDRGGSSNNFISLKISNFSTCEGGSHKSNLSLPHGDSLTSNILEVSTGAPEGRRTFSRSFLHCSNSFPSRRYGFTRVDGHGDPSIQPA